MSDYTLDYLARLLVWTVALCLVEGVLLTASWGLWSRVLRRASAESRHRLACAHFAGFVLLPALSLAILHWSLLQIGAGPGTRPSGEVLAIPAAGAMAAQAPVLAAIWLAGGAVSALRLAGAWRMTRRLDRKPAPADLMATVARLARTSGLRRAPMVAIAPVATPQVIGWPRPSVLVPVDLTERLTPAEVEAILLHELAHVRCNDYAWNMLQRALLAVIWFHPGAWVVYAGLRGERELRCDHFAARRGRSGAHLAMALVRLAERSAARSPALALPAASGELATRVVRLVEPGRPSPRWLALTPLVGALGLCATAVAAGAAARGDPALRDAYLASAFAPAISISAADPAGVFQLRIRRGRVLGATVGPGALPARVVQRGQAVTLIDRAGGPVVAITVSPEDHIHWQARRPAPA
jgi:beta-lactamase regulating signal transducer with metallopeptidase domain